MSLRSQGHWGINMNTNADKAHENKSQAIANGLSEKQSNSESTFQFVNNRPEAIAQRKLKEMANIDSSVPPQRNLLQPQKNLLQRMKGTSKRSSKATMGR